MVAEDKTQNYMQKETLLISCTVTLTSPKHSNTTYHIKINDITVAQNIPLTIRGL